MADNYETKGTHLKLEVVGLQENIEMLDMLRNLDLTSWFANDVAPLVRQRLGDIIDKGIDRDKWPALHPFTLEHKTGRKIMVESGALYKSITSITGDSIFSVSKGGLELGSKLPYAAIHNYGGKIKVSDKMRSFLHWKGLHLKETTAAVTIPKREYLFVSKALENALYNSFAGYVQGIIAEWKR